MLQRCIATIVETQDIRRQDVKATGVDTANNMTVDTKVIPVQYVLLKPSSLSQHSPVMGAPNPPILPGHSMPVVAMVEDEVEDEAAVVGEDRDEDLPRTHRRMKSTMPPSAE